MVCLSVLDIKKFKEGVAKNNKPYKMYDLSVQQEDTKAQYKASLYVEGDNPVPKVGTEIEADVVKKDKYTNINKWRELGVKKEIEIFKGTKPGDVIQTKDPLKNTYPTKEERDERGVGISALALCKVKAIAHGYNEDADDIREDIYKDYIFFLNRLSKND